MTPADARLRDACRDGQLQLALRALDEGADVHAVDAKKLTALHHAAMGLHAVRASQYVDLCILLVEQGADIDSTGDGVTGTPLFAASVAESLTRNQWTGDALVALGADTRCLTSSNPEGLRLLCLDRFQAAAKSGRPDLMLLAIEDDWDHETVHQRLEETANWARAELPAPELMIHTMRVWLGRREAAMVLNTMQMHVGFQMRCS